jgi:hypothetical protein
LSTLRLIGRGPISHRSSGNTPSSSRSRSSRTVGTAQISECTAAFTSEHHAAAAAFAAVTSVADGCSEIIRSRLA